MAWEAAGPVAFFPAVSMVDLDLFPAELAAHRRTEQMRIISSVNGAADDVLLPAMVIQSPQQMGIHR